MPHVIANGSVEHRTHFAITRILPGRCGEKGDRTPWLVILEKGLGTLARFLRALPGFRLLRPQSTAGGRDEQDRGGNVQNVPGRRRRYHEGFVGDLDEP